MPIVGLLMLLGAILFVFTERDLGRISVFDMHAFVIVLVGSISAILISSSAPTVLRTLALLRELLPGKGRFKSETETIESERVRISELWREGKRSQAVELAESSVYPTIAQMLKLLVARSSREATQTAFTELRHQELSRWQPAVSNWELLSRLGPSFGMMGTIAGMIQLFKNMASQELNIGAAMSLALLSTLYGVLFGAGIAGPVGHYLRILLDERLGVLERCEQSVHELTSRSAGMVRS